MSILILYGVPCPPLLFTPEIHTWSGYSMHAQSTQ